MMELKTYTQNIDNYSLMYQANRFDARKRTVIFIHGIGVSSEYYIPLLEEMRDTYNIFALDLPGYGKTKKPTKPLTIDTLSKIVLSFLSTHELQNVILIGHSMGCQIATHTYNYNASMIHKLILLAPTVNHQERTIFMQGFRLLQDTFFEPLRTNIVIFTNYIRMGVLRYLKTSQWMVRDQIENILENISIPTLIIRGENDQIVPNDWVQYLSKLSPSISVNEVPKAPHAFQHNHPKETAQLCKKFIEN